MCKYDLDEIALEVKFRETYFNVYYNWRLPDVYQFAGKSIAAGEISSKQLKKWVDVMNKVKAKICADNCDASIGRRWK